MEIFFNTTLKFIYISLDSNALFTLPVDIFQNLQNLQVLTCTNNLLNTLTPGVFRNLTSLISLDLSYNYLLEISDLFGGLSSLEHLQIQFNMIHSLPAAIFYHCKNLKFINFSTNSISIIGDLVFNDTNIQTLDLRSNDLYLVTKYSFINTKLQDYTVLVDESATCCFADNVTCISEKPRPVYLTCKKILNGTLLQISMWSLGLFTFVFNYLGILHSLSEKPVQQHSGKFDFTSFIVRFSYGCQHAVIWQLLMLSMVIISRLILINGETDPFVRLQVYCQFYPVNFQFSS